MSRDNGGLVSGRNREHWPGCFCKPKLYTSSLACLPRLPCDSLAVWYVHKFGTTCFILIPNSGPAVPIPKGNSWSRIWLYVLELDWFRGLFHHHTVHETPYEQWLVSCSIKSRHKWLESRNGMGSRDFKCYVHLRRVGFSNTHCRRDAASGTQVTNSHVSVPISACSGIQLTYVIRNLTMLIGCLTSVPIIVAAMFTTTDFTEVMNSGFPAVQLVYQVTGNRPLTIFLGAWLIVIYACTLSQSPFFT